MAALNLRTIMYVIAMSFFMIGAIQSRAVNISNTWMLPEEGFPVFYRHFRDRISWYEADAVCQFHHANLVTADSTSQYDAIRAYLKELDITEKVWIGLSKSTDKPVFSWTNFQPLTGEGHWQDRLPAGDSQSLCAVMDPAADFLWRPLPCGGPEVAAFICELSIPSWALGVKGCLLTELPSLTVLYIPEQSALELTSDCGLDGTKRIACKGNADREQMLKQLTCSISNEDLDDDKSVKSSTDYWESSTTEDNSVSGKTTKSWTSNTIETDYGVPTRHRRETEDTLSPISTKSTFVQTTPSDLSWKTSHQERTVLTTENIRRLSDNVTPTSSIIMKEISTKTSTVSEMPTSESRIVDESSLQNKESTTIAQTEKNILKTTEMKVKKPLFTEVNPEPTSPPIKFREAPTISTKAVTSSVDNEKVKIESHDTTSGTTTQESNLDEYPSAISQGQLFSIIDNGTMFDIIELNDTETEREEAHESKITEHMSVDKTTSGPTTVNLPKETHILTTTSPLLETIPTKKQITKKTISPTKKLPSKNYSSKKDLNMVSKSTTTKPEKEIYESKMPQENLTKEFEMLPDIKDSSIKLNRTFRKELPPMTDEHTDLESGSHYGVPKIMNFAISNNLEGETYQQDHSVQELNSTDFFIPVEKVESKMTNESEAENSYNKTKTDTTPEIEKSVELKSKTASNVLETVSESPKQTSTEQFKNPIDPRLFILNHHPNLPKNNYSETISPALVLSSTSKPEVATTTERITPTLTKVRLAKEEYLPKSLLGETVIVSSEPTKASTSQSYDRASDSNTEHETFDPNLEHPFPSDEPKKVNRHRSLHTNKPRKFYPYFFSRMLG